MLQRVSFCLLSGIFSHSLSLSLSSTSIDSIHTIQDQSRYHYNSSSLCSTNLIFYLFCSFNYRIWKPVGETELEFWRILSSYGDSVMEDLNIAFDATWQVPEEKVGNLSVQKQGNGGSSSSSLSLSVLYVSWRPLKNLNASDTSFTLYQYLSKDARLSLSLSLSLSLYIYIYIFVCVYIYIMQILLFQSFDLSSENLQLALEC